MKNLKLKFFFWKISHGLHQCFLKVGEIAPLGRLWWARGQKKQRGKQGAKMLTT